MHEQLWISSSFELLKYFKNNFVRNEKLVKSYTVFLTRIFHFLEKKEKPKIICGYNRIP